MGDADATACPGGSAATHDPDRLVVGVVEDLDLQPVARPFDRADRVDHAVGDVALVVDRDLDAYARLNSSPRQWGGGTKCRRGMSRLNSSPRQWGGGTKCRRGVSRLNSSPRQWGGGTKCRRGV